MVLRQSSFLGIYFCEDRDHSLGFWSSDISTSQEKVVGLTQLRRMRPMRNLACTASRVECDLGSKSELAGVPDSLAQ